MTDHRGREVTGFAQDDTGVDVELSDGNSLRAEYLVGCDGGRSLIRRTAGIEFPAGTRQPAPDRRAEMTEEPELGLSAATPVGIHASARKTRDHWWRSGHKEGGPVRSRGVTEQRLAGPSEPTPRDLSEALIAVYGTDFGIHSPTWIQQVHRHELGRRRPTARDGCCWPATPHTYTHPVGGQGLNTGVQDAVNLGWKLAQVVNGTSPREPPRYLPCRASPDRVRACCRTRWRRRAASASTTAPTPCATTVSELLSMDEPRKRLAAMMSGLDIHYDLGAGHPLLGRRMPDLDLVTADGPLRALHPAARCAARCSSTSVSPARRHHSMGGPRSGRSTQGRR